MFISCNAPQLDEATVCSSLVQAMDCICLALLLGVPLVDICDMVQVMYVTKYGCDYNSPTEIIKLQ